MFEIPFTKAEYLKMFSESPVMHGSRVRLLKFHFSQPGYLTTAPAMAKAMRYANFNAANLQYGSLAKALVTSMNWDYKLVDKDDGSVADAICAIVKLDPPSPPEFPYWTWTLWSEAVEALKELGW